MADDSTTLIARLRSAGDPLPPELRAAIVAGGRSHLDGLLQTLDDETWWEEGDDSDGWGPIHAVEILAELGPPEAIPCLLHAYARTDPDDLLHDRITVLLPRFGAAALEPVLAALGDGTDLGLCEVLANLGVRDERLFTKFCAVFEQDVTGGSVLFSCYGDARALPRLEEALDQLRPDFDQPFGPRELIELCFAHRKLGGTLPPRLQARVDGWFAEADARRRAAAAPRLRLDTLGRDRRSVETNPALAAAGASTRSAASRRDGGNGNPKALSSGTSRALVIHGPPHRSRSRGASCKKGVMPGWVVLESARRGSRSRAAPTPWRSGRSGIPTRPHRCSS